MSRPFSMKSFDEVFEQRIVRGEFNEIPEYYPRYKSRYVKITKLYAGLVGPRPVDLLDVGGGQFATLAAGMWGDRGTMVDLGGKNYDYLKTVGVRGLEWNLCDDSTLFDEEFDVIIFSEVIEHLPLPGYVILQKLKKALRPGGLMICTTPNFYRMRNVIYMLIGKRIFDNFRKPTDRGFGHVLEYDRDHLRWQFEQAGFEDVEIEFQTMPHKPHSAVFAAMSMLGSAVYAIPRFRDMLVAVARKPVAAVKTETPATLEGAGAA